VREARRFLADLLDGCPAADDVLLVASELAANAVLHSASSQQGGAFTIAAEVRADQHVRIEVCDQGGPWDRRGHRDGRPHGLDIIACLATSHGVSGDPLTGWTSWAILPWHPAPPAGCGVR
jgi:two-component sensor histidine kinase